MDPEHASATTESGNKSQSASQSKSPVTRSILNHAEDLDDNFDEPILIHLVRNTTHCTCGGEQGDTASESDICSPSIADDFEATPAEKESMAHIICSTPTPVYGSSYVSYSPGSSVDSDEFYTPEISQEIFATHPPNSNPNSENVNLVGEQQLKGTSSHNTKDRAKISVESSASETQPKQDSPLAVDTKQNIADLSTTSSMDDLEVYWRHAHQRLVSSILDIPPDAFDPFMPHTAPDDALKPPDVKTRFTLSIPPRDYVSSEEVDFQSPSMTEKLSSESVNLSSLWMPPSTSQTLPHTPDRPNWALAPDEISPTPPKSTSSQRRSKDRSVKSERQNKDAKRWLTPSPLNVLHRLDLQSVRRHLDAPEPEPNPGPAAEREVIAIFSPKKTAIHPESSFSSSQNVAGNGSHHPPLSMAPEDVFAPHTSSHLPPLPNSTTSPSQDVHFSNPDFLHERHAELLRQNQALVALLRSHYQQHSINNLSPSHRSPQHIIESPLLESSPADVHHSLGPDIDEKGFQRSRTTISPALSNDHKLKRRASWRKSVSLPTISEATVGSVQGTPSHPPVEMGDISVPRPTCQKMMSSQDPIPSDQGIVQKEDNSDTDMTHLKHNQIKWPSRSEELAFHERANPTLSLYMPNAEGDAGQPNFSRNSSVISFDETCLPKTSGSEGLKDVSLADSCRYSVPFGEGDIPNGRMHHPIEDTRVEEMLRDRTTSGSHPKGRNDPSRSSAFMSNIPIAVRLQRKTSFTNQHTNEVHHTGGFVSPSGYMGSSGYESKVSQIQSSWPPKSGSTKITSDWRQNLRSSALQELRATSDTPVDHIAKPVFRTRSLQGLNQHGGTAAVGSTTSPSTVTRSRFAAPPQGSLPLSQAASVDLSPVQTLGPDLRRMKPEQRSDFNSRRSDTIGSREHARGHNEMGGPHSRRARGTMRSSGSNSRSIGQISSQTASSSSTPNE